MRRLSDTAHALDAGLAAIRTQFALPAAFPAPVLEAAHEAALRVPTGHTDRTDLPFVTLDPASSRDLDQAFTIEASGQDLLLHYAIADVGWFVTDGDVVDAEAWNRGTTVYLPDGRVPLYPPVLSEAAASLLPDGPRPAIVLHVRLDPHGVATLDGAERAIVRSRAKLAYESVRAADVPASFAEFARRVDDASTARGASNTEPPEQAVERTTTGYDLVFRPRLESEDQNAALSLAANMAVGQALYAAKTGLFRVMPEPDDRAVQRLRHTAAAFGLPWPPEQSLAEFVRGLDANDPRQAAFIMAERRAGGGASYAMYQDGVRPWHAALAATYSHATAPLRRLADRYTLECVLAVVAGQPLPDAVAAALPRLTAVMAKADSLGNRVDRAAIDLAEAVMLHGSEGTTFAAVVVDDEKDAYRVQLKEVPVVAKVAVRGALRPGDEVRVKLASADPATRSVHFDRVA